jgi:hypothetical protein
MYQVFIYLKDEHFEHFEHLIHSSLDEPAGSIWDIPLNRS